MVRSVSIRAMKDWRLGDRTISRPSQILPGPESSDGKLENAITVVFWLLQSRQETWQFTIDPAIRGMKNKYPFIHADQMRNKIYRVTVDRSAANLPQIYEWYEKMHIDLNGIGHVPWVHPAHTLATWGFCPYCEAWVTHENWDDHYLAECLGHGRIAADYCPPLSFFKDVSKPLGQQYEVLHLRAGGRQLLRWERLIKAISGNYACYGDEPRDASVKQLSQLPPVWVYGSKENAVRALNPARTQVEIEKSIAIGTVITTSLYPLTIDAGYFWGTI